MGSETELVTEGSQDEAVPGAAGSDAATEQGFSLDGENFTPEQMREAIESWRDRDAWNASFKQRDQRLAGVRDSVQAGFGKKWTDLDEQDLMDLKAMGLVNAKLRSEPAFAKAWEESLIAAYKQAGASPSAAREAAGADVAAAKAGEPAKLPSEIDRRVGALENVLIEQSLTQFEGRLDGDIKTSIDKVAGDLAGRFYPFLRGQVLHGLSGYSDADIVEKHRDGTLAREVVNLARGAAKTLREYLAEKGQAAGAALTAAKDGAAPAPVKGEVGERVEGLEYKAGAGMSKFHDKMRVGLGR